MTRGVSRSKSKAIFITKGRSQEQKEEDFPYVSRISMIDLLSIEEANKIYEFNENPALLSSIGRDLCHSIPFDMGHENEISPYTPRKGVALTPEEERSFMGKA